MNAIRLMKQIMRAIDTGRLGGTLPNGDNAFIAYDGDDGQIWNDVAKSELISQWALNGVEHYTMLEKKLTGLYGEPIIDSVEKQIKAWKFANVFMSLLWCYDLALLEIRCEYEMSVKVLNDDGTHGPIQRAGK